jgi:hypothetical protein
MILYTISRVWILSQPIVKDDRAATTVTQIQAFASLLRGATDRTI